MLVASIEEKFLWNFRGNRRRALPPVAVRFTDLSRRASLPSSPWKFYLSRANRIELFVDFPSRNPRGNGANVAESRETDPGFLAFVDNYFSN